MNSRVFGIMAFAGLLLPTAALAQPVSDSTSNNTAVINKLQRQERMDEFKAKFWTQEPLTQQDYYVQERQTGS